MTLFFKNDQIDIYRRRQKGSTNRYGMSATYTTFNTDIQPASQQRIEMVNGRIGATFTAFVEATVDIKEGDQVLTESGKRYSVQGVQHWQGAGLLDHIELIMVAVDG